MTPRPYGFDDVLSVTAETAGHPIPVAADRVAGWRDAAKLLDQRASSLDALSSSDFSEEARAIRELAAVACDLRDLIARAESDGDHDPVWVIALDGDGERALNEDGRPYMHCGTCGAKKPS